MKNSSAALETVVFDQLDEHSPSPFSGGSEGTTGELDLQPSGDLHPDPPVEEQVERKGDHPLANVPTVHHPPSHQVNHPPRRGGPMRFTYPTGSRPLEGYAIKRGIGTGGFGEVYFAVSDAGKEVALKRILRNLDIELRGVRQCLNLKHPNLIGLYDIRYDDLGQAWVVMEYVSGETLKETLERCPGGMPLDELHDWFEGMAAGVIYLHQHGIVHRDLKPANIFSDEDVVKIGDYGLSKFISASRRGAQTESVGTFHYMAPEIGKGVYGKEIDVYALGVMLFEMISGRVPFDGESGQEIIMKHLTDTPDTAGIDEPYRRIIIRALAKDPDLRFTSVSEMLAEFRSARHGGEGVRLEKEPVGGVGGPKVSAATPQREPDLVIEDESGVASAQASSDGVMYIGDEDPQPPEIVLGDVKEIVTAEPIANGRPPSGAPQVGPRPGRTGPAQFRGAAMHSAPRPVHGATSHGYTPGVRPSVGSAPPLVTITNEEPVARAVKTGCCRVGQWWNEAKLNTPVKVGLLIALIVVIALTAHLTFPLLIVMGAVYLVYFGVRCVILAFGDAPSTTAPAGHYAGARRQGATRSEASAMAYHRTTHDRAQVARSQRRRDEVVRQTLSHRSVTERLAELVGSMLMSAVVCGVVSFVLMMLGGKTPDGSVYTWSFFAWMTMTSVAAAWTILALGKFWEGSAGETGLRRFVMLVAGLAVGAAAWAVSAVLMVEVTSMGSSGQPVLGSGLAEGMYAASGAPQLPAYLIFFSGLFVILRWWRQADPIRKSRFSVAATIACVVWGWILEMVLQFPQPWGLVLAAVVSISVQLSAPWINPKERSHVAQRYQEA